MCGTADFSLFEEPPLCALFGLGALLVVSPLDGIAHGRHLGGLVASLAVKSGVQNFEL
jgi:hypothetical protein